MKDLILKGGKAGDAERNLFWSICQVYHQLKKPCLHTFYNCQGNRYNKDAYSGVAGECPSYHTYSQVFRAWHQRVDEKRYAPVVEYLKAHYDLPNFVPPGGFEDGINLFFMAKFGMFTCHDVITRYPLTVQFDEDLIKEWLRTEKDRTYNWLASIASCVYQMQGIIKNPAWDLLESHRKQVKF